MTIIDFIRESNAIEGIYREPTQAEIDATNMFLNKETITLQDMVDLVKVYQPNAVLRNKVGLNVRVGNHVAPYGGTEIAEDLSVFLAATGCLSPYALHHRYETLHPFTDGNGRSGRTLWAWHMKSIGQDPFSLSFLHRFYYQSLGHGR